MSRCVLGLYRSSVPNVRADRTVPAGGTPGAGVPPAPGLVLIAADDPVEDQPRAQEMADSLGARAEVLPGAGHWWMFGSDQAAKARSRFWDSLPRA